VPRTTALGDRFDRDTLLLVVREEDRRSVAHPDVVALPVERARIMYLEEEIEDFRDLRLLACYIIAGLLISFFTIAANAAIMAVVRYPSRVHWPIEADDT
jgi:hypothetical protein